MAIVGGGEGRPLQRYALGHLVLLLVVAAVLFGVASTETEHFDVLFSAALGGIVIGAAQCLYLGGGLRGAILLAILGLIVGVATAKIVLGEANLNVVPPGVALILGTAIALRLLQAYTRRRGAAD